MATRQYIGARYVPKFYQNSVDGSTAWESNVVYEPLIYVTLQNGHMYISKKQVPATVGTPASNVEYWLDIGNYNGYIEDLQTQIDDINDDIEKLTDFGDELTGLKNKKVLIIGDSISDEALYPNCWVKDFKAMCSEIGCDVTNYSLQGRTIGRYTGATNYLMNILSGIPSNSYDEIIVFLGTNDWFNQVDLGYYGDSNVNSVINNMLQFEQWKYQHYPTANVTFITPLRVKYANDSRHKLMQFYCTAIASTANYLGFGVIDAHSFAPFLTRDRMSLWTHDGIHPRDTYSPYLARYIFNNIIGRTKAIGNNNIKTRLAIGDKDGLATRVFMNYSGDGECNFEVVGFAVNGTGAIKLADLPEECQIRNAVYGLGQFSSYGTVYMAYIFTYNNALYCYKSADIPDGAEINGTTTSDVVKYQIDLISASY